MSFPCSIPDQVVELLHVPLVAKGLRGIDESAAWAIATKINKQGTELWRKGGREDIVTPAINDFQSEVSTHLLEVATNEFIVKIRELQW